MMNTEQDNILISEFIDLEISADGAYYYDATICEFVDIKYLNFSNSWDMLMQVVEKIETTSVNVPERFRKGFMKNTLKATGVINSHYDDRNEFIGWSSTAWLGTATIFDSTMLGEDIERYKSKIEAVYKACIAFIKWYNKNLTSQN